ncbi:MAG TPA: nucleotidyltransferase domain-containing protein [bacterium]|nr:nucleotidyltransferase domain-containing protein [bacterium]
MENQTQSNLSSIKSIISTIIDFTKIYLFGSRSREDYENESDYDLLIVIKQNITGYDRIKLMTEIRKKLAENKIDADIIIKTNEEINEYKNIPGHIVSIALNEGYTI